jgi:hypothetical protein
MDPTLGLLPAPAMELVCGDSQVSRYGGHGSRPLVAQANSLKLELWRILLSFNCGCFFCRFPCHWTLLHLSSTGLSRCPLNRVKSIQLAVPIEQLGGFCEACAICPTALGSNPIVYTLGIGTIINTDLDLIARYKRCETSHFKFVGLLCCSNDLPC